MLFPFINGAIGPLGPPPPPAGGWGGGGGGRRGGGGEVEAPGAPGDPLIKGKGVKGKEKGEAREEFNGDCWSKQDWKCDKAKKLKDLVS